MIDFNLHSEIPVKTKESSQASHGLLGELFSAQDGTQVKEEFTKALQEILGSDLEGKEAKALLENAKNQIIENGGDSKAAQAQMNSLLQQLMSPSENMQQSSETAVESLGQKSNGENLGLNADLAKLLKPQTSTTGEQAPVLKSTEATIAAPAGKMTVHDLLLDKSTATPVTKESLLGQMSQGKQNGKMQLMGGDDFLAQKVAIDKNQLMSVEGEKVSVQKMMSPVTNTASMKQYGAEQNVLDNRMFVLKASEGDAQATTNKVTNEAISQELELLGEASHGPERMANKLIINSTQNEAQVDISTAGKVLDLSKIDITKTNELISKISDYIEQAQFEKTQKLDLVVKHDQLGQFKIQVNRTAGGNDLIDIKIQSSNAEAHKFFVDNEVDLLQSLSKSGIKVADLKITTGLDASSLSQQGSQEQKDSKDPRGQMDNGQKSMSSNDQKSQEDRGSQKRRDLWELYRERYSA